MAVVSTSHKRLSGLRDFLNLPSLSPYDQSKDDGNDEYKYTDYDYYFFVI